MPINPSIPSSGNPVTPFDVRTMFGVAPGQRAATPQSQELERRRYYEAEQEKLKLRQERYTAGNAEQEAQLAATYGDDPDTFISELSHLDPTKAQKYAEQLHQSRLAASKAHIGQAEDSIAHIDLGVRMLQGATPQTWGAIRTGIAAMSPELAPLLPEQYADETRDSLIQMGLRTKDFVANSASAAKLLGEGKTQESFWQLVAGANNQQQFDQAKALATQARMTSYVKMLGDTPWSPELKAQATAQAMTPKDQYDTAHPETAPAKAASQGSDYKQFLTRFAASRGKTLDTLNAADELAAKKAWGQADDHPRVSVNVSGAGRGAAAGLERGEGGGLELAATAYRLTGKMVTGLARTSGAAQAVLNEAAAQNKLLGRSAAAAIQKQAAYQGDTSALKKMQQMASQTEAYETKALAQADIVDELSAKVPRSSSPMINGPLLAGKAYVFGDPNVQSLYNSLVTFTAEYAKVISGGVGSVAASSDSARREAASLISAAMGKGTLSQQVALMRLEMRLTMQGYDTTIQHITDRLGGQMPGESAPVSAAPGKKADPLGIR